MFIGMIANFSYIFLCRKKIATLATNKNDTHQCLNTRLSPDTGLNWLMRVDSKLPKQLMLIMYT
jgi:hypothetical protein